MDNFSRRTDARCNNILESEATILYNKEFLARVGECRVAIMQPDGEI